MKLPKGRAKKLVPKYIGPFEILTENEGTSYKLAITNGMKAKGIKDTFHVNLLKPFIVSDDA